VSLAIREEALTVNALYEHTTISIAPDEVQLLWWKALASCSERRPG
jgi:hypothetical protein